MPRSRILTALLLAGVAIAAAAVVMLVAWDRGGAGESTVGLPSEPETQEPAPPVQGPQVEFDDLRARSELSPRIVLFGDVLRARVDVVVDNTRIDPASVRVAMTFSPWEVLGEPERIRRDAGTTSYLSTRWTLRCLIGPCVPSGQVAPLEFGAARDRERDGEPGHGAREVVVELVRGGHERGAVGAAHRAGALDRTEAQGADAGVVRRQRQRADR